MAYWLIHTESPIIQIIQLRLSLQKRKLRTMSAQGMLSYCLLGPRHLLQGITFVASKFAAVSFLFDLENASSTLFQV